MEQANTRVFERLINILGYITLASWIATIGFEMSWSGHRPLKPDVTSGRVIPFNNHGILYISYQDLFWWHAGLYATGALLVLVLLLIYVGRRVAPPQP